MRYDHETRKKQNLVRIVLCVFMGLFGPLAMGVFSVAQAQVACYDVIDLAGGTVKLTSDLNCGNQHPGVTVTGPGTLNLNRHTVTGPGSQTGILVLGEGAEIVNGTVKGWSTAVLVQGVGNHKIVNLKIENNNTAIRVGVGSNENNVVNNFVRNNSSRGIRVDSYANQVINNYVENSAKGIRIDQTSANNTIVANILIANNQENCDIKGNDNLLVRNIAKDGGDECFLIDDSSGNTLVNNTALNCDNGGFVASVKSSDNYISHNKASGNTPFDLRDDHGNCAANTWFKNVADSAYPDCILSLQ